MGKFEAFDIEYDTDGESVTDLPEVVSFEADGFGQAREIAAEAVTVETGWLVVSLEVREV